MSESNFSQLPTVSLLVRTAGRRALETKVELVLGLGGWGLNLAGYIRVTEKYLLTKTDTFIILTIYKVSNWKTKTDIKL
jgi:hypothetical protein